MPTYVATFESNEEESSFNYGWSVVWTGFTVAPTNGGMQYMAIFGKGKKVIFAIF
jgi:hypothetical protein